MPPKSKREKGDAEYVPSSEEEEEEILEESSSKKKPPVTKPKKTRPRKKDDDPEDTESEEISDTEKTTEPSSDKKKQKSPSPGGDDKKKMKSPVTRIVEGVSAPIKKFQRKFDQITTTDDKFDLDSSEASEIDKVLKKFKLPSDSRRHVYNKNIAMIGSFNIQAFGIKKSSNTIIMRIVADILRSYDIILCQEIRANEDIIQKLAEEVSTPATPYAYVLSHPIGRTTYQERYVYLYRKNEWTVMEDYVIDDDEKLGDIFIREPYVARFQHLKKSNVRITLVGCHTQPENALEEIKGLVTVAYNDVKKKLQRDIVQEKRQLDRGIEPKERNKFLAFFWRYLCCCFGPYAPVSTRDFSEELTASDAVNEPIVMMGDLNAAGSYVNKSKRSELDALLKKNNFMWGIQHTVDTTVADGPDTAYDRFIFEIANERKWIGNTGVWRFDEGWLKENSDTALVKKAAKRVSDHYPIEFELKLKPS